ncbi:g8409 [Coccomyxa elongata]
MPEGKLLGRVVLTCPKKEEILELPGGTPVVELLSKAAALFGRGRCTDRSYHAASEHRDLAGGFYTWSPEGGKRPGLYVCQKGARRWPDAHGPAYYVEQNADGLYSYDELAGLAGYDGWITPKYIIQGHPEILRIYPIREVAAIIDHSELGDWGTKGKSIPVEGVGWWGMIKEFIVPRAKSPQPQGVEVGQERCTALNTH